MGTILRYVHAHRHTLRAFAHRLIASGECANRLIQPPVGAQRRRAIHSAHRGHGCREERGASSRRAHRRIALARTELGRGAGCRRPERALPAVGAGGLVSVAVRTAGGAGSCVYPCYCTPEELELSRKLQRMAGKPPRYAGTCRFLTAGERAARLAQGLRPTLRFAVPDAARHRIRRCRARAAEVLVERHRRFHHSPRGRDGRVLLFQCRGRFGHGRHARLARR